MQANYENLWLIFLVMIILAYCYICLQYPEYIKRYIRIPKTCMLISFILLACFLLLSLYHADKSVDANIQSYLDRLPDDAPLSEIHAFTQADVEQQVGNKYSFNQS